MTSASPSTTQRTYSPAAIVLSSAAIIVAWCWFALVLGDTYDDECKARAAGTSDLQFLLIFGVAPLVLVSAGALIALLLTTRGEIARRVLLAVGAFLAATAAGVLIAWAMSGWTLFAEFAIGTNCYL
ncbi:hypothetical protein ABIC47_003279 [Leifsonia sp. 563]|uniref:hypothetical protein n=1 Tax=Leifsonia sp. 563 TaxID=3156412 RepID=UPI0033910E73